MARSASAITMAGAFPPSSRFSLVIFGAAAAMIAEPVSTLPVKLIIPILGEVHSAFPAPAPRPWTMLITPRRQVRLRHQLAELHRVVRRLLARLNHDGVARDQRRRRLARNQEEREVPRQDAADHAD